MIRIINGDCRDVLKTLPDGSVQCCVTSPPYFNLRNYGIDGQIGLESSPDEYIAEMVAVFLEVRRVLRTDGTCWLNLGDSYNAYNGNRGASRGLSAAVNEAMPSLPTGAGLTCKTLANKQLLMIPARVAIALQADGWWLRSDIIWVKPNPMPESVTDRPTSSHEHVFLLTKSARYFYDQDAIRWAPTGRTDSIGSFGSAPGRDDNNRKDAFTLDAAKGRNAPNAWMIATQPFPGSHFATMPPELAERCIMAGTSERGACPSCGAPWVRVVETDRVKDPTRHTGRAASGCLDRQDADQPRMLTTRSTTGWSPSCSCPPADPRPCVVLDPFSGAGTTALVADRLRRDAIGIELNPAYTALSTQRITADAGLFAEVSG